MKITVTVAIEHNGYSSEYGKAIEAPGEPSGIHEKAFHDLCDVVLYSAGGEFGHFPGDPLQHRMHFMDYRDPNDEFEVVATLHSPDKAEMRHQVECLIMFAEKLSGLTFERVLEKPNADAGIDRDASDAEARS